MHTRSFSARTPRVCAFFRDVLGLSSVDTGGGWPIFVVPAGELATHPAADVHHEIYLMCDDVHATVSELETKGVEFIRPITENDWGRVTAFQLPDGDELALYEPTHPRPLGPTR